MGCGNGVGGTEVSFRCSSGKCLTGYRGAAGHMIGGISFLEGPMPPGLEGQHSVTVEEVSQSQPKSEPKSDSTLSGLRGMSVEAEQASEATSGQQW